MSGWGRLRWQFPARCKITRLLSSTSRSNLDGALTLSKRCIKKPCCWVLWADNSSFSPSHFCKQASAVSLLLLKYFINCKRFSAAPKIQTLCFRHPCATNRTDTFVVKSKCFLINQRNVDPNLSINKIRKIRIINANSIKYKTTSPVIHPLLKKA